MTAVNTKFRWQEQRGQALVLFVLMLVVLMGAIALAVDGGYAYAQRRRMQYAADAAAMAGARALAMGGGASGVEVAVAQYAQANGADTWSWTVSGSTVRVQVSRTFPTFFAGIVGIRQMTASATAEASVSGVRRAGNLLPIAVEEFSFEFNKVYKIWDKETMAAPGNFGWLDWNGGSRSLMELANYICNPGLSGEWEVGSWVPGSPGVKIGQPVRTCLNKWIGQPVTIPIYDAVTGAGANTKYRIAGFAQFVIEGYNFKGSNKYILGRFVRYVTSGEGGGPNFGLVAVTLGSSTTDLVFVSKPKTPEPPEKEDDDKTKTPKPTKETTPEPTKTKKKKTKTPEPTEAPKPPEPPEKEKTPTPTWTPTPCEDEYVKGPEPTETKEHEKEKTKTPEPTETKEHEKEKTKTPEPTETKEHEKEKTKTPEPPETPSPCDEESRQNQDKQRTQAGFEVTPVDRPRWSVTA